MPMIGVLTYYGERCLLTVLTLEPSDVIFPWCVVSLNNVVGGQEDQKYGEPSY